MKRCLLTLLLLAAAAPLRAEPASPPFSNVSVGAIAGAGIGTGLSGDNLMLELGAESAGITARHANRWLLQWDGFLTAKGGYLANEHPFQLLLGGHGGGYLEEGYRFQAENPWSPYFGLRGAIDLQVLVPPGVGLGSLYKYNSVAGVGGFNANAALGFDVGASLLSGTRSLLLVAFFQTALQLPWGEPGHLFHEGGLGVRFDIARSVAAGLEAAWGRSATDENTSLNSTDQTTHEELSLNVRKIFGNGMWLAGTVHLARDSDHVEYAESQTAYDTANAPVFGFSLVYGFPIGSQE